MDGFEHPATPNCGDCEDENYSDFPILDTLYKLGRNSAIIEMTNFSYPEITMLFTTLYSPLLSTQSQRKRAHLSSSSLHALFMSLTVLKNEETWTFQEKMFNISTATFEQLTVK